MEEEEGILRSGATLYEVARVDLFNPREDKKKGVDSEDT